MRQLAYVSIVIIGLVPTFLVCLRGVRLFYAPISTGWVWILVILIGFVTVIPLQNWIAQMEGIDLLRSATIGIVVEFQYAPTFLMLLYYAIKIKPSS